MNKIKAAIYTAFILLGFMGVVVIMALSPIIFFVASLIGLFLIFVFALYSSIFIELEANQSKDFTENVESEDDSIQASE